MPGIAYTLGLDASKGIAGLDAFKGALGGLSHLAGIIGPIAGIAGGLGLAATALAGFKKSISEAAQMEQFETGFKVLLGSQAAAVQRMRELTKFSDSTPFELPQVAEASRVVQVFTKGLLATGAGLRLVGDVASATQRDFGEIAPLIGQLFQELNSGGAEGHAAMELERMGALSADAKNRIEQLQRAGAHGPQLWNIAAKDLSRYTGMMSEQAKTWNGLMSTFRDKINAVFREFGTPILDQIKPILSGAIDQTDKLSVKAHQWGVDVAWVIGLLRNLYNSGNIGEYLGASLRVGFSDAVEFLATSLQSLFAQFDGKGLFSGLGEVFEGLGLELAGSIQKGIIDALKDVKIMNVPILQPHDVSQGLFSAYGTRAKGAQKMEEGIGSMKDAGGFMGQLAGVLDGLHKTKAEATAIMQALQAKFAPFLNAGLNGQPPAAAAPAQPNIPSVPRFSAEQHIKPLTDRLAQIGLFIGGAGGVRGQRAAQDTARNTYRACEILDRISSRLVPHHAHATF